MKRLLTGLNCWEQLFNSENIRFRFLNNQPRTTYAERGFRGESILLFGYSETLFTSFDLGVATLAGSCLPADMQSRCTS